jgi:MSHA biogenesis protein MshI
LAQFGGEVLGWLRREKKVPGWFAMTIGADRIHFAHGRHADPKSQINAYGTRELEGENADLTRAAQAMHLGRYECAALLRPGDYQLLLVEAPNVPKEELKSAIRWRIKDMINYHVDDATVDVLDIPQADIAGPHNRLMYAVSAKNEIIESIIRQCDTAKIPLSVIDIPETAQRNLASLYEDGASAVGLVYFAEEWGLVTLNFRHELYLARRFEIGFKQVTGHAEAVEAPLVEIQRTLDHFDRQFRSMPIARVLIAPTPTENSVAEFLKARVGIQAQDIDLRDVLAFDGEGPDRETQWRLFHHFGAALRHETRAL